ncbi:MAG: Gfo/Idh/MocA family oxidoreductase [Verrucomicrobia bacterium]|nr:Gfo/Idh/MocA family oxidoreductase [Verrucomicrobiota bacterium]
MNPIEPLRIGVAGLHHDHAWGLLHSAFALPGIRIVGAADPYPALRERFERDFHLPSHDSYEAILTDETLDAVWIFTDNRAKADLACAAAARGLHVLVEKPLAADGADARRMIEAVQKAGVRLMVNWPYAWWPALQHAIRLAGEGHLGRIWHVRYRGAHQGPENCGCSPYFQEWLFDAHRNGGGVLVDYCCYGANLASTLLGPPQSVTGFTATLTKPYFPLEDNATLIVRYPEAMATLEGSWSQVGKLSSYLAVIQGTVGTFLAEPYREGRLLHATAERPDGVALDLPEPAPEASDPAAHFLWALTEDKPFHPLCDPLTGLQAQLILDAGAKAAWEHREISL